MTSQPTVLHLLVAMLLSAGPGMAGNGASGSGDTRVLRFRVVNTGPHRVRAVYVSPSKSPGWGENLLGRGLDAKQAVALRSAGLRGGGKTEIAVDGPCGLYDIRLVADKGL